MILAGDVGQLPKHQHRPRQISVSGPRKQMRRHRFLATGTCAIHVHPQATSCAATAMAKPSERLRCQSRSCRCTDVSVPSGAASTTSHWRSAGKCRNPSGAKFRVLWGWSRLEKLDVSVSDQRSENIRGAWHGLNNSAPAPKRQCRRAELG